MQLYGVYILVMGVNGITEAFVMAKADEKTIRAMQKFLFLNSV